MFPAATLPDILLGALLVLAMAAVLVLVLFRRKDPVPGALLTAATISSLSLIATAVLPWDVPLAFVAALAVIGAAAAIFGGDPVTRRILNSTTGKHLRDGKYGGILLQSPADTDGDVPTEVMRGGTAIGYLERAAVTLAIIAGFPEAIALVVALKGIGRFSELVSPEARGRFIVGTLASLVWASVNAGVISLTMG